MQWKAECGKVLKRFTQALGHNEEVWIFAARFQNDTIGLSRTLLLEGLRFHPDSIKIYREYFMLEIQFLKNLKENPDLAQDLENPENIQNGEIIKTVFTKAIEATKNPLFANEMLTLVNKNNLFTLYKDLQNLLMDQFGEEIWIWTILANLKLYPDSNRDRSIDEKFENCGEILLQGLEKIQSLQFIQETLKFIRQIGEEYSDFEAQCGLLAFKILEKGQKLGLLNDELKSLLVELE